MLKERLKKRSKRTSDVFIEMICNGKLKENLTYGYIISALGDRSFGMAVLLFALPNVLPFSAIPGFSTIFGVLILIFSLQMMLGRKALWLPKRVAEQGVSQEKMEKLVNFSKPYLQRLERLLKPRWTLLTIRPVEYAIGMVISVLALLLMLPIPFSNFILGLLICLYGLGLAERDGILISVALLSTLGTIMFIFIGIRALIH